MSDGSAPGAFSGHSLSAARWFAESPSWWDDHFTAAAGAIVQFLTGDGIAIEGARILDLGCGDGIISAGLASRGAQEVVGVDLQSVDVTYLDDQARQHDLLVPDNVRFEVCTASHLPFDDAQFDIVVSWSVFEHVADPLSLLREVHRVLKTNGALFMQVWPLWNSQHGAHMWPWFSSGHEHLVRTDTDIETGLRAAIPDPQLAASFIDLFRSCNRASIDELQSALIDARFYIAKVQLQADTFHVRPELQRVPLSQQGISGIQLVAVRH
ncbi:MAG: hypothetical protein JWN39_1788 [Ilumatobacteraceae bacterium]|nr:hypothetical protein [Ilumatobacteraceae bacterium]